MPLREPPDSTDAEPPEALDSYTAAQFVPQRAATWDTGGHYLLALLIERGGETPRTDVSTVELHLGSPASTFKEPRLRLAAGQADAVADGLLVSSIDVTLGPWVYLCVP